MNGRTDGRTGMPKKLLAYACMYVRTYKALVATAASPAHLRGTTKNERGMRIGVQRWWEMNVSGAAFLKLQNWLLSHLFFLFHPADQCGVT